MYILVAVGTTRKGVLLMMVRLPVIPGGALEIGILVEAGIIMNGVPWMLLVTPENGRWPEGTGNLVDPEMAKNGVFLMIVIDPGIPDGAFTIGILVAEGRIMTGDPFTISTRAPGMLSGRCGDWAMKIVEEGTTINLPPSEFIVCPGRPKGAMLAGTVVCFGTIMLTPSEESPPFLPSSPFEQPPI